MRHRTNVSRRALPHGSPPEVHPRSRRQRPTRILVASQQSLHRHGLATLLGSQEGLDVVGQAASPLETAAGCERLDPDVLVLNAAMPDLDGTPAILAVHAVSPRTRVLVFADSDEERCPVLGLRNRGGGQPGGRPCDPPIDCLQLAVARGALGAIRANAEPADLFRAVRTVASGTAWYEAGTASRLLARALATTGGPGARALSARDVQVASLVAEGHSNKEIAHALEIGEPTVKRHVSRVLNLLRLADRVQLALYLVRHPQVLEAIVPAR